LAMPFVTNAWRSSGATVRKVSKPSDYLEVAPA
jgi:hypothetical protein